jgi:ABC-type multidrug transport system fused ATPase/permease subunit
MLKTIATALKLMWLGADTPLLKLKTVVNLLIGVVSGVSALFSALVLSWLVRDVSAGNTSTATLYLWLLVLMVVLLIGSRAFGRRWIERENVTVKMNLKRLYYKKIFYKPYNWHLHNSVGYFSSALDSVCNVIASWYWKIPYDYISNLTIAIGFIVYSASVSWILFGYFVVGTIILMIITRLMMTKRLVLQKRYNKQQLQYDKSFIDFLYNIRSVKKLNLLKFVRQSTKRRETSVQTDLRATMNYNTYQWGLNEVFNNVQFFIPLIYFVLNLVNTGQGIEYVVVLVSIQPKFADFGRYWMHFMSDIMTNMANFQLLSEHVGDDLRFPKTKKYNPDWHTITFDDTKFEHRDKDHLFKHHVEHFTINRGDHVAIVGRSGEGKSTFLNLLTNQFTVERGLSLDGRPYNTIPTEFFDNTFAYVSQDVELFDMTLHDNIVLGRNISDEELNKIIEGCCLDELVNRLDGNLHVDIGEKGVKVSGGEKQRISLARGLLLDRDILVLDEITANLDPTTTRKIWQFLFREYSDKTIVAISHEDELIKHVNKAIEFRGGAGVEVNPRDLATN